jgi:NADH-quinone oxidoreductase subunit J
VNGPFFILAAVTLVAACAAMMLRGLVHCALALAVTFAGIGALYINVGAQFLGLAQLLVYVGAVAVLIVFVILLTRSGEGNASPPTKQAGAVNGTLTGALVACGIFAVLAWAITHSDAVRAHGGPAPQTTIRGLGLVLMEGYVLPLEVMGVMLTAALIGAVIVAMKERPGPQ